MMMTCLLLTGAMSKVGPAFLILSALFSLYIKAAL